MTGTGCVMVESTDNPTRQDYPTLYNDGVSIFILGDELIPEALPLGMLSVVPHPDGWVLRREHGLPVLYRPCDNPECVDGMETTGGYTWEGDPLWGGCSEGCDCGLVRCVQEGRSV